MASIQNKGYKKKKPFTPEQVRILKDIDDYLFIGGRDRNKHLTVRLLLDQSSVSLTSYYFKYDKRQALKIGREFVV